MQNKGRIKIKWVNNKILFSYLSHNEQFNDIPRYICNAHAKFALGTKNCMTSNTKAVIHMQSHQKRLVTSNDTIKTYTSNAKVRIIY